MIFVYYSVYLIDDIYRLISPDAHNEWVKPFDNVQNGGCTRLLVPLSHNQI